MTNLLILLPKSANGTRKTKWRRRRDSTRLRLRRTRGGLAPLDPKLPTGQFRLHRVRIPDHLATTRANCVPFDQVKLAEEEGFEPSSPGLPVKRFSRPPHSTALPPLRLGRASKDAPYDGRRAVKGRRSCVRRSRSVNSLRGPRRGRVIEKVAERQGFEPWIRFWRIHDFQSCSFGQLGHLSAAYRPTGDNRRCSKYVV